jgi:hypothetical protein
MKTKVPIALLTLILLLPVLNAAQAKVECPLCNGTGVITRSETCQACGGIVAPQPDISLKRHMGGASGTTGRPATSVSGIFHNAGEVGAYGVATAQVRTTTETYTNTSERTYFPPNADTTVTVIVEGIAYAQWLAVSIDLTDVESDGCTVCGGTGAVTETMTCPDCDGTGFVDALPAGEGNSLVVVAAAVGVATAVVILVVVVVRRKRVTEESLRRLPPSEFQNWVIQRLSGRASSQKESSIGIDGYTVEGYPIQIKQLGDVGRSTVDSFASAMGRSRARTGVIVALSFDQGTFEGTVRAKLHYGFEIKTVTVRELIENSGRPY